MLILQVKVYIWASVLDKSMTKLVVWDWNGTLLADTQLCVDAGNHVIETFGGKGPSREEYLERFSFPVIDFYAQYGADREAMLAGNFSQVFHEYYKRGSSNCRTRRGARVVLDWLRHQSIDSLILSNHLQPEIVEQLGRLGIESYFQAVLAHQDTNSTATGNNKVGRVKEYLTKNSYAPGQIVVIGDSPEDMHIGREIGAKTIGITDGYFSLNRLRASQPDYLVTNLYRVIGILKNP